MYKNRKHQKTMTGIDMISTHKKHFIVKHQNIRRKQHRNLTCTAMVEHELAMKTQVASTSRCKHQKYILAVRETPQITMFVCKTYTTNVYVRAMSLSFVFLERDHPNDRHGRLHSCLRWGPSQMLEAVCNLTALRLPQV